MSSRSPFLVVRRSFFAPKPNRNACYTGYLAVYASRSAGSFHEKRLVIEQSSPDIHTLEKLKQMDERKRTFETRKTKGACVFGWKIWKTWNRYVRLWRISLTIRILALKCLNLTHTSPIRKTIDPYICKHKKIKKLLFRTNYNLRVCLA